MEEEGEFLGKAKAIDTLVSMCMFLVPGGRVRRCGGWLCEREGVYIGISGSITQVGT